MSTSRGKRLMDKMSRFDSPFTPRLTWMPADVGVAEDAPPDDEIFDVEPLVEFVEPLDEFPLAFAFAFAFAFALAPLEPEELRGKSAPEFSPKCPRMSLL